MGMPVTLQIADVAATEESFVEIFDYFRTIDKRFSTYKKESEITLFNDGKIAKDKLSPDMQTVFRLAEETKRQTDGFFDINFKGMCDPSGLVKGWAIHGAADILRMRGYKNFYLEVGGDIEVEGMNTEGKAWSVGIRNPFNHEEIVKVVYLSNKGIATSGTAVRGQHIYNPITGQSATEIASLTVIGPTVYEADRFATAAFAMGRVGIEFIEQLPGFEGYTIDHHGIATYTSGFTYYTNAQSN